MVTHVHSKSDSFLVAEALHIAINTLVLLNSSREMSGIMDLHHTEFQITITEKMLFCKSFLLSKSF